MFLFLCFSVLWAEEPSLELATQYWREGDVSSTISSLERVVYKMPTLRSNRGDSVRYLLGKAYFQRGDYGLAARQFANIRWGNRILEQIASYDEATSNWKRGYHYGLKRNCDRIRSRWPGSKPSQECLLMLGDTYQLIEYHNTSQQSYDKWLNSHTYHSRYEAEYMRKLKGLYTKAKQEAYALMRILYFDHKYPTTTRVLRTFLKEEDQKSLHADEFVSLFWSTIRTGKLKEGKRISQELESLFSWISKSEKEIEETLTKESDSTNTSNGKKEQQELFEQRKIEFIKTETPQLWRIGNWERISTPVLKRWYGQNQALIYWKTKQYDKYAQNKIRMYERTPNADLAWRVFQGYVKGAEWEKAVAWASDKQPIYEWRGKWVRGRQDIALAYMYVKDYERASKMWSRIRGRKALFMTGFCYYMSGSYERARSIFTRLNRRSDGWDVAGIYWSTQSYLEEKNYEKALELANDILDDENALKWYQLLLQQQLEEGWFHEEGLTISYEKEGRYIFHDTNLSRFTGHSHNTNISESDSEDTTVFAQWSFATPLPPPSPVLSRDKKRIKQIRTSSVPISQLVPQENSNAYNLPDGYPNSLFAEEVNGRENYNELLKILPYNDLIKAKSLIEAGFHDDAAPLLSKVYENWKLKRHPNIEFQFWRSIMLYARNHHYAMRFTVNLAKEFTTVEEKAQARRLNFPIVRAKQLFPHCESLNLDPYLMYAIMRVESTYRDYVVSPAGAIGYIQVMPLTGAKLADILEREDYSPKDLEDPQINLQYGTHYFSMLMRRFGYAYPLAAASYNGGPHNISRWLKNLKDIRLDQFVEHIAFDESRIYAKKVSTHYANYVELYEGHPIKIPWKITKDDASIVDF